MKAFDNVIGYSAVKKELMQISDTLKNPEVYRQLGASSPRGLLLYGEPGVGKTLMATELIKASGRKAVICRKNQPNGDFVKTIKAKFNEAAKNAPSIIFLDDMDKFANGDERHRDAEEYVTVQSCIDEIKGEEVFVLATANNIRTLPHSLRRAGRFDRVIEIEAPRGADAEAIIAHYLESKRFVGDVDPKTIARIMSGRSCAELETVINEAGLCAGYERAEKITMEHFMEACMRTIYGLSVGDRMADGDDDDWYDALSDGSSVLTQIIYHEAGHAVVSEVLRPGSVTIVSTRGSKGSSGGFTSYEHDANADPRKEMQRNIVSSLGGMAALEQKFGIYDLGCSKDLDNAFDAMRKLVVDNCICGFQLHASNYGDSEELQTRQAQAVASEIEHCYRTAKEILAANSEFLEKTASALARKGLLTMVEIREIRESCVIRPTAA